MATHKKTLLALLFVSVLFASACNKSLVVKNVNYAHQIETVLTPDEHGTVTDVRHGLSYSIMAFQLEEFRDTSSVMITEVRMIRNTEGYYFITAEGFKHVYVMAPKRGELKLEKKILVSEQGINSPAFNWRKPVVQLVDQNNKNIYLLTEKGVQEPETKKEEEGQS